MGNRQAYLRRARHWLANRGWRGLVEELWYRLRLVLQGKPVPGRPNNNQAPHPFDLTYGVDTGGLVWGEALDRPKKDDAAYWATGYYGISPSAFTDALTRLNLDWPQYTFVDVGCGKGRALLLALRFPFRRVLGIELSASLAEIARQNLASFQPPWRCSEVAAGVVTGDATEFAVRGGPLVFFLYHPFAAPLMKRFLAQMQRTAQEQQRPLYLLYANPELHSLVAGTPGMEWLWKETFALTEAEGAADRFGSYGEQFSAYRMWAPPQPG